MFSVARRETQVDTVVSLANAAQVQYYLRIDSFQLNMSSSALDQKLAASASISSRSSGGVKGVEFIQQPFLEINLSAFCTQGHD